MLMIGVVIENVTIEIELTAKKRGLILNKNVNAIITKYWKKNK